MPFPLVSRKPPALSYTRPAPRQATQDPPKSRVSSFTDLLPLGKSQTRAVGAQHRRTTESTMRVRGHRSISPPVVVTRPDRTNDGIEDYLPTLEIYAEKTSGFGGGSELGHRRYDIDDDEFSTHSTDEFIPIANLPDPDSAPLFSKHCLPLARTRVPRDQLGVFRKVSGQRTRFTNPQREKSSIRDLPAHSHDNQSSSVPGRRENRDLSPCSKASRSTCASVTSSDLNRPLPPLPLDHEVKEEQKPLRSRKAVPRPLGSPYIELESIDMSEIFNIASASQRGSKRFTPVANRARQLTLDEEIRQVIGTRAKEHVATEAVWHYRSPLSDSPASTPEVLTTPKDEETEISFMTEELDAQLADLVVELKRVGRVMKEGSPRSAKLNLAQVEDKPQIRQSIGKTVSPRRGELEHINSVKVHVDTTEPVHLSRPPPTASASKPAVQAIAEKVEHRFIPANRSFAPIRSERQTPSGPRAVPLPMSMDQFPFQELNRQLKPVRTGDRVRSVVDRFEGKANVSRGSSPRPTPVTPTSGFEQALEKKPGTSSTELTLEGKRLMAQARAKRRPRHVL